MAQVMQPSGLGKDLYTGIRLTAIRPCSKRPVKRVTMQVIVVQVRGENFGLPAQNVVEIIRAVAVSPLPGSPTVISGVINVRGDVVVVIDPAVRFGKPETAVTPHDNFVLVATATRTIAVRVDIAEDLVEIDDALITAARSASPAAEKIHGVAAMSDGALVIYDVGAFLTQAENEATEQALSMFAGAS